MEHGVRYSSLPDFAFLYFFIVVRNIFICMYKYCRVIKGLSVFNIHVVMILAVFVVIAVVVAFRLSNSFHFTWRRYLPLLLLKTGDTKTRRPKTVIMTINTFSFIFYFKDCRLFARSFVRWSEENNFFISFCKMP